MTEALAVGGDILFGWDGAYYTAFLIAVLIYGGAFILSKNAHS